MHPKWDDLERQQNLNCPREIVPLANEYPFIVGYVWLTPGSSWMI